MFKFTYSAKAPAQEFDIRLATPAQGDGEAGSELKHIKCVPGKTVELPVDHKMTQSLFAAGFLEKADKDIPDAVKKPKAPSDFNAPLADVEKGHARRLHAIGKIIEKVSFEKAELNGDVPKLGAINGYLQFTAEQSELDAVVTMRANPADDDKSNGKTKPAK